MQSNIMKLIIDSRRELELNLDSVNAGIMDLMLILIFLSGAMNLKMILKN